MTMNPLYYLDALLADWTSARVRRTIHTLLLLAASLVGVWLAAEGDWIEAGLALVALIYAGANRANTYALTDEVDEDDYDEVEIPGDGYYPEDVETATDLVSGNARSDLFDEIATEDSVSSHAKPE